MRTAFFVAWLVCSPALAHAWNATGHRVIASIAYRELDKPTRAKVAGALMVHPAAVELWLRRPTNSLDEQVNAFWNASIFPDDARRQPWTRYGRARAHYVNFRILTAEGNRIEPPGKGENILTSYAGHLRKVRDPKTDPADRAVHLSWIFHQVGDIHQPLHAVARVSAALPEGDRGGNSVRFPNPRGSQNLHAYWDDLLGSQDAPDAIERIATELMAAHPRDAYGGMLERQEMNAWAEESAEIAVRVAYHNLDPGITAFADRPVGYEADAVRVAESRVTLAGYRLADVLKRVFGE